MHEDQSWRRNIKQTSEVPEAAIELCKKEVGEELPNVLSVLQMEQSFNFGVH